MASVKDIKAQISNLKTSKPIQIPSSPKIEDTVIPSTTSKVIEYTAQKENTQTDKGLGAFFSSLTDGKDYGRLPGIPRPVLFKRGALKILRHLNYHYTVALIDKTVVATDKLIAYTVLVTILTSDDKYVGQALGAANSLESKFAKSGMGTDSMLVGMATKRGLIDAVRTLLV